jgi:hypothetical protein
LQTSSDFGKIGRGNFGLDVEFYNKKMAKKNSELLELRKTRQKLLTRKKYLRLY